MRKPANDILLLSLGGNGYIQTRIKIEREIDRNSLKLILFTSCICGNIVWIGYQAFLTAKLAIVSNQQPFTDLESLSKTDWTLVTFPIGFPHSFIYTDAVVSSTYANVFENNMDLAKSFSLKYASAKSILETLKKEKTAVFVMEDDVKKSIQCQVLITTSFLILFINTIFLFTQIHRAWTAKAPFWPLAMALRKRSPYTKFLNRIMGKMLERGQWSQTIKSLRGNKLICLPEEEYHTPPISINKASFLFFIFVVGLVCAIIALCFETLGRKSMPKSTVTYQESNKNICPNCNCSL